MWQSYQEVMENIFTWMWKEISKSVLAWIVNLLQVRGRTFQAWNSGVIWTVTMFHRFVQNLIVYVNNINDDCFDYYLVAKWAMLINWLVFLQFLFMIN